MDQLTLLPEDSPAKTSASQVKEQDSKELAQASGGNTTVSSNKRSRSGSSQKTSQPFALEDWIKCSGRSLRSGMMQNGIVYPLQPLALLTDGTESGLWRTPAAANGSQGPKSKEFYEHCRKTGQSTITLVDEVRHTPAHWPTPTAVWRPMEGNVRMLQEKVMAGELDREEAAQMIGKDVFEAQGKVSKIMWPTPTLQDTFHKNAVLTETGRRLSKDGNSSHSLSLADKVGGQLNPAWVEWLMGFPIGHTDLSNLETP